MIVGAHRQRGLGHRQRAIGVTHVVVVDVERATRGAGRCDVVAARIGRDGSTCAGQRHRVNGLAVDQPTAREGCAAQRGAQAVLRAGVVGRHRQGGLADHPIAATEAVATAQEIVARITTTQSQTTDVVAQVAARR